jgi:hypothetical protein
MLMRRMIITVITITVLWIILTIIAESTGGRESWKLGNVNSSKKALVIFSPDPFYNLDEQVCKSFGKALAENGYYVNINTVAAATRLKDSSYNLYVFCANTYNLRPDWAVSNYIQKDISIKGKPVIAITLGAGSTAISKRTLERLIFLKGGNLLSSRTFWLWKPNDETRSKESNVDVAVSMAYTWSNNLALQLKDTSHLAFGQYNKR